MTVRLGDTRTGATMRIATSLLALLVAASPLAAQTAEKATMLADWQRSKENVLRYVDAMPDSLMTYRPTPGVRTFAEQMEHIVSTNNDVAATAILGLTRTPAFGDSTRFLYSRSALHEHVEQSYDYLLGALREATPAQLAHRSSMYRQPDETTMRWLQLSLEHTVWTMGQVVPYLRLNHVTPPAYSMPF